MTNFGMQEEKLAFLKQTIRKINLSYVSDPTDNYLIKNIHKHFIVVHSVPY